MRSANLRESFWRTLLTFNFTRVVIAILLLLYVAVGDKRLGGDAEQFADWQICVAYLLLAISFATFAFYYRARFVLQMLIQMRFLFNPMVYFSNSGRGSLNWR